MDLTILLIVFGIGYILGDFFGWNQGFRVGTDDERARWQAAIRGQLVERR